MTHKEEVKLNRLQMKLEAEKEIVDAMLNGRVEWHDGEGKGNIVLRVFAEERLSATVTERKNASCPPRYFIAVPDWKMKMGITDEDLTDVLDEGVKKVKAGKPKAKKGKPKAKGKKFRVWFQVMGRYTDSNNIGYAIIEAKDKEEAIKFAEQDLMKKKQFKNVEVVCRGRNEDFDLDEDEQDEDDPLYCFDVDWEADGKHGRYYARSGPYAKDEEEATQFGRDDVTKKNGFMGFENELEAEEEND